MILSSAPSWQTASWQELLQQADISVDELCDVLDISGVARRGMVDACASFKLRVPAPYMARIKAGDADDPLLRQVLPQAAELLDSPGFVEDPLQEKGSNPAPGVIHKYRNRLLFIVAAACAVHCRYCFRRHFPYQENQNSRRQWEQGLSYLRDNRAVDEVIFSGGDPLVLPDRQLKWLVEQVSEIAHVKRLRIHTRLPIVIPQRIDDAFCTWVESCRLPIILVVHCNHAQEIDEYVGHALGRLSGLGVTLYNQSVLLKGVNDNVQVLVDLSEKLFDVGVQPYYLHCLDRVQGSAHFEVELWRAKELYRALQGQLSGYMMPRFVREVAGSHAKQLVM